MDFLIFFLGGIFIFIGGLLTGFNIGRKRTSTYFEPTLPRERPKSRLEALPDPPEASWVIRGDRENE